jgi:hypothetical protein
MAALQRSYLLPTWSLSSQSASNTDAVRSHPEVCTVRTDAVKSGPRRVISVILRGHRAGGQCEECAQSHHHGSAHHPSIFLFGTKWQRLRECADAPAALLIVEQPLQHYLHALARRLLHVETNGHLRKVAQIGRTLHLWRSSLHQRCITCGEFCGGRHSCVPASSLLGLRRLLFVGEELLDLCVDVLCNLQILVHSDLARLPTRNLCAQNTGTLVVL